MIYKVLFEILCTFHFHIAFCILMLLLNRRLVSFFKHFSAKNDKFLLENINIGIVILPFPLKILWFTCLSLGIAEIIYLISSLYKYTHSLPFNNKNTYKE
ncbi:MAG: hypothetical protein EXX96DRAFT_554704 [Benjaminiella poitrasii]|nr:MAG: hypothetical protein EXX96DRAFT_554704 [Benjaminiella poitrasii]